MKNYDIIRFYKSGRKLLIHIGITEQQAKEWCNSEKTQGKNWFDGFTCHKYITRNKTAMFNHYFNPENL